MGITATAIAFLFSSLLLACVYADCSFVGDTVVYPKYYQTQELGQATYYGVYSNGGACTLDPTPYAGTNVFSTVAIANNIWDNSMACGMCINMTASGAGSGGSPLSGNYIVFVNNDCPSCAENGIDIGQSGDGVWDISWHAIPCPVGSSKMQFMLQGSNPYYIKLQVRNTRYPVYGVSILQSGSYRGLVRTADNFFTAGSTVTYPITFPLTVKVTSSTGDYTIDSVPSLTNGQVMNGATQFPDCSSSLSGSTVGSATTSTSGASSTSGTTGTGSSSTTGSQNSVIVYEDSVQSPFSDWSWAQTRNWCDTSTAQHGACSYSFSPADYQAIYFHTGVPISSNTYSNVEFFIKTLTSNAANYISFAFVQGSSPVYEQPISSYATVPPNSWTKVTVPMPPGSYDGMWFQDKTGGSSNPTVYLDSVRVY